MHIVHLNQRNQILFQYLRDKKKKKKRKKEAQKKGGVKIHPFHLPWIRAWLGSTFVYVRTKNVTKRDAIAKKGMLSCFILSSLDSKRTEKCQKMRIFQESPLVNGLNNSES